MGLLGNNFRRFVGEQVKIRQVVLGEKLNRNSKDSWTKSMLTNTPWVRLASSVNLENSTGGVLEQMKASGLFDDVSKFKGDELAKNFVLFGGVTDNQGGINNAYSGINTPTPKKMFGGAYGFGSWDKLFSRKGEGYKPMPGITNMEFSYRNDGALSQGTVTVKAFSKAQFQIIDVLFQRPGYTVLLEFGHSVFVDNKGTTQYAGQGNYSYSTEPFNTLFNPHATTPLSHYNLSSQINREKRKWSGNYEGAFMKISKFNWKYNMDGSYDITVNLVGTGDIISSLKAKVLPIDDLKITDKKADKLKEYRDDGNFLVGNSQSSKLNQELFKIYKLATENSGGFWKTISGYEGVHWQDGTIDDFNFPIYETTPEGLRVISTFKKKDLTINNGIFTIEDPDKNRSKDVDGYDDSVYITFGYLISLISQYINLKTDKGVPYLFYDFNYVKAINSNTSTTTFEIRNDSNFISTYQGNMSSDPTKVLIPFKSLSSDILDPLPSGVKGEYDKIFNNAGILNKVGYRKSKNIRRALLKCNSEYLVTETSSLTGDTVENGKKGRLDRVYLDINFIAKVLDDNTSKEEDKIGECSLIDVLKTILEEINSNLGGINEFRIMHDQDTQLIKFVSEVPIIANSIIDDYLSIINVSGLEKDGENYYKGSFVKSVDLKAELNDDFATLISIGAQNSTSNLQGNSGAFGLYNKGLKDRVIPEKNDVQQKGNQTTEEKKEALVKTVISEDLIDALQEIYRDYNFFDEYIDIVKQYNTSLSPFVIGELAKKDQYPTPFFLPFNLGLTFHGLGGLRVYDGFKIDGKILPSSYDPSSISLIIKSLSHSVNLDGWTTKIETIPKPIFKSSPSTNVTNNNTTTTTTTTNVGTSSSGASGLVNNSTSNVTTLTPIVNDTNTNKSNRKLAMEVSHNHIFDTGKGSVKGKGFVYPKPGFCARGTYNLAYVYCQALKVENKTDLGNKILENQKSAGGNANSTGNPSYSKSLSNLGYTRKQVGKNIDRADLEKLVEKGPWGYGDVIMYYCKGAYTPRKKSDSHFQYGHTQIYIGDIDNTKGRSDAKWATDNADNYRGVETLYRSRTHKGKWDFVVYLAPKDKNEVLLTV